MAGGGILVRHDRSGLAFRNGDVVTQVTWPYGYSAADVDGSVVLIDPVGNQVAREGDPVQATGAGGTDMFYACTDIRLSPGNL